MHLVGVWGGWGGVEVVGGGGGWGLGSKDFNIRCFVGGLDLKTTSIGLQREQGLGFRILGFGFRLFGLILANYDIFLKGLD